VAVLLPFAVGLLGSQAYSSVAAYSPALAFVLGSLYYIPILIAAIVLGARAALFVALAAGAAYALGAAMAQGAPWIESVAQTLLFVCVALTTAKLAQWRAETHLTTIRGQAAHDSEVTAPEQAATQNDADALSRVIVGLVHQFRTPVTSIEGAGWVLDDPGLPDDKRRELVGIVRNEAHRLSCVLSDVMEFTQPRRRRFRAINVPALVDDVIQLAGTKSGGLYILVKNIPPDLPAIRGDPEQLKQVLLNLVMNSIQATPAGGQIEITATSDEDTVLISVKDQGRGIPPAAFDRIFDPFFTTDKHRLGLGLPVALRIVTDHGGKIVVDSQRNEGTCFCVTLPKGSTPLVK
jgi:signal transduction histidine kinase